MGSLSSTTASTTIAYTLNFQGADSPTSTEMTLTFYDDNSPWADAYQNYIYPVLIFAIYGLLAAYLFNRLKEIFTSL